MQLKVCGMRNPQNIKDIVELEPDYIGLIFYEKSPRFVGHTFQLPAVTPFLKKAGVFVNESVEKMRETAEKYALDTLQLHGGESSLQCLQLREEGFTILKAFSISTAEDLAQTVAYEGCCDYFLFDTKTQTTHNPSTGGKVYGGSGQKFDWSLLEHYQGETPFFLSGGIDLVDVEAIKQIKHPQFTGVDINSRFETEPAMKDVEKVKQFKSILL